MADALPLSRAGFQTLGTLSDLSSLDDLRSWCSFSAPTSPGDSPTAVVRPLPRSVLPLEPETETQFLRRFLRDSATEDCVVLVNLRQAKRRLDLWYSQMEGIEPYYAVKCNPDAAVIKTLALLGVKFDCASPAEIGLCLAAGSKVSDIIFANPCKAKAAVLYARSCDLKLMTFDNSDELLKLKATFPECHLLLRIQTKDDHSSVPLSTKFGAALADCPKLLTTAKELGLSVIGISFHCGSGCHSSEAYATAIQDAHEIANWAVKNLGMDMKILDIGGGFPGRDDAKNNEFFCELATTIKEAVKEFKTSHPSVRVIAEPGRYFVESTFTVAVSVTDVAEIEEEQEAPSGVTAVKKMCYTVSEGVYGVFKDRVLVNEVFLPSALKGDEKSVKEGVPSMVIGPSGHELDVVVPDCSLPALDIGDWLEFKSMGAYTLSLRSCFHNRKPPQKVYCWI